MFSTSLSKTMPKWRLLTVASENCMKSFPASNAGCLRPPMHPRWVTRNDLLFQSESVGPRHWKEKRKTKIRPPCEKRWGKFKRSTKRFLSVGMDYTNFTAEKEGYWANLVITRFFAARSQIQERYSGQNIFQKRDNEHSSGSWASINNQSKHRRPKFGWWTAIFHQKVAFPV